MVPILPEDVLHLISIQLWHMRDFGTLYNCALSSKSLAALALSNIYRMYDVAPVTYGGGDDTRPGDYRRSQNVVVGKWANLWRTMVLSSLGKTAYPYCRYVRALNLRDLNELLEDARFRDKFSKGFFAGELSPFLAEHHLPKERRTGRRLDMPTILDRVGEALTQQTPMVEDLAGDIMPASLGRWIPRLRNLHSMTFWDGGTLVGNGAAVREYCPRFRTLKFYAWQAPKADDQLASFLDELRPVSLESFEIFSRSSIGGQSFLALSGHGGTLTELKLNDLESAAMPFLSSLRGCTSLVTLHLSEANAMTDLKKTQKDTFLDVIDWLLGCTRLRHLSLWNFLSAPQLLAPVLRSDSVRLTSLSVLEYPAASAKPFYDSLAHQAPTLRHLFLKSDSETPSGNDLVGPLALLRNLSELQLRTVSNTFRDRHLSLLAQNLPALENLWISGVGITDAIWPCLARLSALRRLELNALSHFTLPGILDYVARLGPGNRGLSLTILMDTLEDTLTYHEQALVRDAMAAKVDGRFDYTLPIEGEYVDYSSSSDSD